MTYTKKYLRPSQATVTGEGVAGQDRWLIRADANATRDTVLAWFLAEPGSPVPGVSLAEVNGKYCVSESVDCEMHPKSRLHWFITANYSPFDTGSGGLPGGTAPAGAAIEVTKPSPKGATPTSTIKPEDPESWDPVVQRRSARRFTSVGEAYYVGGYTGYANTWCLARTNTATGKRCPIVNSALVPFNDFPEQQMAGSVWVFRYLKKRLPPSVLTPLLAFELTIPEADVTWSHKSMSVTFLKHQAFCSSIELSETFVNDEHAWAIEIVIETGDQTVTRLDQGYEARARAAAGDVSIRAPFNAITDPESTVLTFLGADDLALSSPTRLDGNGKKLKGNEDTASKISKWRYHDDANWTPLFSFLTTP
jgi:hypothetical protein